MRRALDWTDARDAAAWLSELRVAIDDVASAAEDQVEPMARRHLGRAEARRIIKEGTANLEDLLDRASRGLAGADPAGGGSDPAP